MDDKIRALLSLDTGDARRAWLEQHVSARDDAFAVALREEADQRKRDNPHASLRMARAAADAAVVWQDQQTRALALHIEADVRQSIARIKASPFIPQKDSVRGFVYEVESGSLREVPSTA